MCGICGIHHFKNPRQVPEEKIQRMADSIRHRGPDDQGYYSGESVGFGFRRLSIIDIPGGHQPMSDPAEKIWVVFNGEIYNFPELKAELAGYGCEFRTNSDTEVIIHGYLRWGVDVLDHLSGMFGMAIWDARLRRLMLARDRMGIKPLYYFLSDDTVVFGSEIKAVLASSAVTPEMDMASAALFLQFRYVPSPRTIFRNIRKLAPGTRLVVENNSARCEQWWNFAPAQITGRIDPRQIQEELLERYRKSFRRHLLSDVPVGLLLSGGLDSGLLAALAHESGMSPATYTVGFGSAHANDELAMAADTARMFGLPNTGVELDRNAFESALDTVLGALEEPVAASSIIPMYFVCKRAAADLKVVLLGQGPDELFGGYTRHLGVRYGAGAMRLPRFMRQWLSVRGGTLVKNETLRRGLYSLDSDDRYERYRNTFAIARENDVGALFGEGLLPDIRGLWEEQMRVYKPLLENTDELSGFQYLEIRSSLPDELLVYADKLGMAHGLEVRVPFLDPEIAEYALRLPARFKIRGLERKWIHRRLCRQYLPPEITARKKMGFETPVASWMRDAAGGRMHSLLLDPASKMYGVLSRAAVKGLLQSYEKGKHGNYKLLWNLVILEEWMRRWLG